MKKQIYVALLLIIATTIYGQDSTTNAVAQHGGILKNEKKYIVEMLTNKDNIQVYVYDSELKPLNNKHIKGNVVFCYTYDACIEKILKDNGNNGFIVAIENPQYYYFDIHLKIRKELITVKFDNQMFIAD